MALEDFKQYVVIRVANPVDEADFFARIFDSAPLVVNDYTRQLDTGAFVLRITKAESEEDLTANMHFEVSVPNVNKFAEDVWNRGIKYASRPQNFEDGFRKVGFVSPGNVRLDGIGPLKMDSTGAFPAFRPKE
jgi:hypothetical protein